MNRIVSSLSFLSTLAAIVFLAMLQAGCEEGKKGLAISPNTARPTNAGDVFILQVVGSELSSDPVPTSKTVEEKTGFEAGTSESVTYTFPDNYYTYNSLALPFEWSVQDPSLGGLIVLTDGVALYRVFSAASDNYVTVRDQYGNSGVMVVQAAAATAVASDGLELTSTATTLEIGGVVTIKITSESSQAPYVWRKLSGPGSLTGASGSKSAVFSGSSAGTAVIQVTDANGASSVIGIVVEDTTTTPGGGGDSGT